MLHQLILFDLVLVHYKLILYLNPYNLPLKKEQSVLIKTQVQFASKNNDKKPSTTENNFNNNITSSNKLPPVKNNKKSNMRASTSNTTLPRNAQKIDRLKCVLDEIKNQGKDKKEQRKLASASGIKAFPEVYEQKIVEY